MLLKDVDGHRCFGLFRLQSNDSWVVRPDECKVIEAGLTADPDDPIEWLFDAEVVEQDTDEAALRQLITERSRRR